MKQISKFIRLGTSSLIIICAAAILSLTILPTWAKAEPTEFVNVGTASIPAEELAKIKQALPSEPLVKPLQKRKILVFNLVASGYRHTAIPYAAKAIEMMGEKTGAYQTVQTENIGIFTSENLAQFDAIVFNSCSGLKYNDAQKKALMDFVKGGKGIVGIHGVTVNFGDWPEASEMFGGKFAGHPWRANGTWKVKIDDPGHALNQVFGPESFTINDELYRTDFAFEKPREHLRVLLSLDMGHEPTRTAEGIRESDIDMPLSWVRDFGRGRVFYTSIGHNHHVYWNNTILRHYLAGIQFACGDLKADTAPSVRIEPGISQAERQAGFRCIFNGKDLSGWDGDNELWSVRDGAITAETTEDVTIDRNHFLIWQGDQVEDFELRCKWRLPVHNSGIYYHSKKRDPSEKGDPLVGPQADISADHKWTGVIMEYLLRGKLAERGQKVIINENGEKEVIEQFADAQALVKDIDPAEWNEYTVICKDSETELRINGKLMCQLEDNDPNRIKRGLLAVQIHTGRPMLVQFKDLRIREF